MSQSTLSLLSIPASALLIAMVCMLCGFGFSPSSGTQRLAHLQAIRSGNYPVMDKDHILVLNWNRQTIPLLRQLAISRSEQQGAAAKDSVAKKHNFGKSKGMFLADK